MTGLRIAVLTMTRDRLDYTTHCFDTLQRNAGCDYDHHIVDQGSSDGTREWLRTQGLSFTPLDDNIGICRALNMLVDTIGVDDYDVIVRYDNDCEVLTAGTLEACARVAFEYEAIVAPKVLGLNHPPAVIGQAQAGEHTIDETLVLGGIFMAIPALLFTDYGFRYDETMPKWTGDEAIVPWWRARGGTAGYLRGYEVNHYERVVEQHDVFPAYQARKNRELAVL